jgi:Arc/MetJ-type ribon-helix-helix transcriptional regulator
MQLNLPPDLESLINKRLSSGAYADAEDVLRRALEAQDAEESWTDEERQALSGLIEEGFPQAERGKFIGAAEARKQIEAMRERRRVERR